MSHRIIFSLSKEAQEQAARAGEPAQSIQECELPQELVGVALDLGASIDHDGNVELALNAVVNRAYERAAGNARYFKGVPDELRRLSARPRDAQGAVEAINTIVWRVCQFASSVIEERRIEACKQIDAYLATRPDAEEYGIDDAVLERAEDSDRAQKVDARRTLRQRLRDERLAEHERAVEAFEAGGDHDPGLPSFAPSALDQRVRNERARREEQKQLDQRQQLQSWIADYGTESQKERFAEGVLSEDEIKQALRDAAFSALAELSRYERITKKEIYAACQDFDTHFGEDGTCEFRSWEAEELTERQFATLKRIRELAPKQATVTARCHGGGLEEDDGWLIRRHSALVTLEMCGYSLSREYSLDV